MNIFRFVFAILVFTIPVNGQMLTRNLCKPEIASICEGIPEDLKARLPERLRVYVEAYRTRDREKVYDLTYLPAISRKEAVESSFEFEGMLRQMTSYDFYVYATVMPKDKKVKGFSINICIANDTGKGWLHEVNAYIVHDDWFFGSIHPSNSIENADIPPCEICRK